MNILSNLLFFSNFIAAEQDWIKELMEKCQEEEDN